MKRSNVTNVYAQGQALSDNELSKFFSKHKLPYHLFENFTDFENTYSDYSSGIIFTGNNESKLNKKNSHHWLFYFIVGDKPYIFDSYGDPSAYGGIVNKLVFKHVQLQDWDSNVCGEYCAAFATLYNSKDWNQVSSLFNSFVAKHGFTDNRQENDEIIKTWWNKEN